MIHSTVKCIGVLNRWGDPQVTMAFNHKVVDNWIQLDELHMLFTTLFWGLNMPKQRARATPTARVDTFTPGWKHLSKLKIQATESDQPGCLLWFT